MNQNHFVGMLAEYRKKFCYMFFNEFVLFNLHYVFRNSLFLLWSEHQNNYYKNSHFHFLQTFSQMVWEFSGLRLPTLKSQLSGHFLVKVSFFSQICWCFGKSFANSLVEFCAFLYEMRQMLNLKCVSITSEVRGFVLKFWISANFILRLDFTHRPTEFRHQQTTVNLGQPEWDIEGSDYTCQL